MIEFTCPHCGNIMHVEDHYAGRSGKCQQCGNAVTVPVPPSSSGGPFEGISSSTPPFYTQAAAPAPRASSNKPVVALVCSILGLMCCVPLSIVGVILGHMAMRETYKGESDYTMALIATVIGYVGLALWALGIISYVLMLMLSIPMAML